MTTTITARARTPRAAAAPAAHGRAPGPQERTLWLVLLAWTAAWAALAAVGGGYSWHYFARGADLLTHPGAPGAGLQLYASNPELQIGPLALVAAVPFHSLGPSAGRFATELVLALLGPVLLRVLSGARAGLSGRRPPASLVLVTGLVVLPVWCQVATHFAHLDDALALAFAVGAVWAAARQYPYLTALLVAGAVDSKPWALGFAALVLMFPPWQRSRVAALFGAGVAAAWLPFVIAAPQTLGAAGFAIDSTPDSALRALGVHAATTPAWDRPAQLLVGVLVAAVCVRRGRWYAVPLTVVTARLLLDPQTYPYYSSGLLLCAAVVDLLGSRRPLPVWSAAAGTWYLVNDLAGRLLLPEQVGAVRAMFCIGVLVALCVPVGREHRRAQRRVATCSPHRWGAARFGSPLRSISASEPHSSMTIGDGPGAELHDAGTGGRGRGVPCGGGASRSGERRLRR